MIKGNMSFFFKRAFFWGSTEKILFDDILRRDENFLLYAEMYLEFGSLLFFPQGKFKLFKKINFLKLIFFAFSLNLFTRDPGGE